MVHYIYIMMYIHTGIGIEEELGSAPLLSSNLIVEAIIAYLFKIEYNILVIFNVYLFIVYSNLLLILIEAILFIYIYNYSKHNNK